MEKEKIVIDKKEFESQIQSHPDYPPLLSIANTLSFFNINGVMRFPYSEIELPPERFIAFLREENNTLTLFPAGIKNGLFCLKKT